MNRGGNKPRSGRKAGPSAFFVLNQEDEYNRGHDAHDVDELTRRWFDVASAIGWDMAPFAREGEAAVYALSSPGWDGVQGDIYFCAGVHGDEPAPVWGLLEWAESNREALKKRSGLIFPCFNPRGLVENTRNDGMGRDLNRIFHEANEPVIREWREFVGKARFKLALTLHEDYDARGCYIYEIFRPGPFLAEDVLDAMEPHIGRDCRKEIDGRGAENGVLRAEIEPSDFDGFGFPEAVYLHFHHADHTLTIETPSEFSLYRRVRAQEAAIGASLQSCGIL